MKTMITMSQQSARRHESMMRKLDSDWSDTYGRCTALMHMHELAVGYGIQGLRDVTQPLMDRRTSYDNLRAPTVKQCSKVYNAAREHMMIERLGLSPDVIREARQIEDKITKLLRWLELRGETHAEGALLERYRAARNVIGTVEGSSHLW